MATVTTLEDLRLGRLMRRQAEVLDQAASARRSDGPAPCGCEDAYAVMWNPMNRVVQCHDCGHVYEPVDGG